ncbi:hypothetical protein H6F89_12340 [Cyanobacteria bacterium FACHB-63]|nr:hypothetical protein [Cyanobacteria bacterium FACHB-63]
MKPDFSKMSRQELKEYVLSHREDVEALDALHERRIPDAEAIWFNAPTSVEEVQQQFERFQQMQNQRENYDKSP